MNTGHKILLEQLKLVVEKEKQTANPDKMKIKVLEKRINELEQSK